MSASKKEGVEAVSGRIQVLAAEMGEVIRSMAERELQLQRLRSDCNVARSPPHGRELKSLVLGLSQMQCSLLHIGQCELK